MAELTAVAGSAQPAEGHGEVHGQEFDVAALERLIERIGRSSRQRTTFIEEFQKGQR